MNPEQMNPAASAVSWIFREKIVLFHNDFSSSGEQPEHRVLAHEL